MGWKVGWVWHLDEREMVGYFVVMQSCSFLFNLTKPLLCVSVLPLQPLQTR